MGACDDMAMNMTCHLISIIARGNWQLARECTMFIYLTYKLHINSAGRALAGFEDTKKKVHSPNLSAIREDDSDGALNKVIHELFGVLGIKDLAENGHLGTFKEVMLASLLEYYEDVIADVGVRSVLIVRLHEVFGKHYIFSDKLREWGKKIKEARWEKMLPTELQ